MYDEADINSEAVILCAANAYEQKYYLNENFSSLPQTIKDELQIMCVLYTAEIPPRGMLSRAASVLRGKTLIVNLPGSPKAVNENLEYILPSLEHGVRIAAGLDGECARK